MGLKYKTVKEALTLPEGIYTKNLDDIDLKARLRTIMPVVNKRIKRQKEAGLQTLAKAGLPEQSYRGMTHKQLVKQFAKAKWWLEESKTSTIKDIRALQISTIEKLGVDPKTLTKDEIGKLWENFHRLKELKPNRFTGMYDVAVYMKEIFKRKSATSRHLSVKSLNKILKDTIADEEKKYNISQSDFSNFMR